MEYKNGNFRSRGDLNICYQVWLPDNDIKAAIIIVHGLGEHSGRYANVVNRLVPMGYAIFGFDLIGHGNSGGRRKFVKQYEDFTDILTIFKNKVKSWYPGKPLFLLGHSMGGLIASEYLVDNSHEFDGAVISAPLVMVPDNINPFTVLAGKFFSIVAPNIGITGLDSTAISRDQEVVNAYNNDPLVFHGKTTARLSVELLRAMLRVNDEVASIGTPFIVLQGSDDRLVNPQGASMLFNGAGSLDKTIKIYDGLYHEIFNEPEKDQVLSDVASWLDAHI